MTMIESKIEEKKLTIYSVSLLTQLNDRESCKSLHEVIDWAPPSSQSASQLGRVMQLLN